LEFENSCFISCLLRTGRNIGERKGRKEKERKNVEVWRKVLAKENEDNELKGETREPWWGVT
jgi:hypothetical protein